MMAQHISEKDLCIQDMSEKHVDRILGMEGSTFLTPWTRASFVSALRDRNGINLVCQYEGDVIGYLTSFMVLDEAFITNLCVELAHRKKGVATALLIFLINKVKLNRGAHIFLEVREKNIAAISLYRKVGFQLIGVRKKYYADTKEDASVMRLSLQTE